MHAQKKPPAQRGGAAQPSAQPSIWNALGSLPFVAFVLVLINGGYIFLVALGNITDPDTNYEFVKHVLMMDTINFGAGAGVDLDPDVMWRSINVPAIWTIGYIVLIAWESTAAIVLLAAAWLFIKGFRGAGFVTARRWGTIGLLMIVILFFGGFITIGGEWFQMWRSVQWNGLDPAFRNATLAAIGLIVLHLPSKAWFAASHRDDE